MLPQISLCPISEAPSTSYHLIFFITGNPGLISYYTSFLETLNQLLNPPHSPASNVFHIYGQSLAGFEDLSTSPITTPTYRQTPYSLEDQIQITLQTLQNRLIPSGSLKGQAYNSIILIGHSVGSYILLEILSHFRQSPSSPPSKLNIKAGILLFPTVTHIAQSPSGLKFTPLARIVSPRVVNVVAKGLVWAVPRVVLKWLVGVVTGMPSEAAEVTTGFLRSRMGIWQALHMAKDEMEQITEDGWDEDIWGIEHSDANANANIPKLIFYFGQKDHWVADHCRDALITARGQSGGGNQLSRPKMLIDQGGVPHGFCIRHSEIIAEKVKVWVDEIMEGSG